MCSSSTVSDAPIPCSTRPAALLAAGTYDLRPAAALELYERLCDLGTRYVTPEAWRTAAERMDAAGLAACAEECRRKATSGDVDALARISAYASQLLQAAVCDLAPVPAASRPAAARVYVGVRSEDGWNACWRSECGQPRHEHEPTGNGRRCPAVAARVAPATPRLVSHDIVRHAAHYAYGHSAKGHDLEQWVIESPAQPTADQLAVLGVATDATYHSGARTAGRTPPSARCRPAPASAARPQPTATRTERPPERTDQRRAPRQPPRPSTRKESTASHEPRDPTRLTPTARRAVEQTWRGLRALSRRGVPEGFYLRHAIGSLIHDDWRNVELPGLDRAMPVIAQRVRGFKVAVREQFEEQQRCQNPTPRTATERAAQDLRDRVTTAFVRLVDLSRSNPAEAERIVALITEAGAT